MKKQKEIFENLEPTSNQEFLRAGEFFTNYGAQFWEIKLAVNIKICFFQK